MSALLLQRLFETKIDEKSHVCWNIDFGGVLEGFWEGFGKVLGRFWEAKILDFHIFFVIFSMSNLECNLEG